MKKLLFATLATASLLIASCTGNGNKADNDGNELTEADSLLFYLGEGHSQGIHMFVLGQLHVTQDTYDEFLKGLDEAMQKEIEPDTNDIDDAVQRAHNAGLVVAWELRHNLNLDEIAAIYNYGEETPAEPFTMQKVYAGLRHGLEQRNNLSEDQWSQLCENAMRRFTEIIRVKGEAYDKAQAEARQQSNADYLAQLEQEADIQKLPTGEYYKVLTEGKGAVPAADETVKVHYEGRLLDGTVFDSSYERNQPIEIDMAHPGVIQGWVDVLKVMPKGSKWEVTLPSELAYGEYGAGNAIPAHSVLVFTMELLK